MNQHQRAPDKPNAWHQRREHRPPPQRQENPQQQQQSPHRQPQILHHPQGHGHPQQQQAALNISVPPSASGHGGEPLNSAGSNNPHHPNSSAAGPQFRRGPPPVHTQSGVPFGHVPAYLPGIASLVEELDQRLLIVLRDGKHIVGTLISYDQFSNIILQDAVERRVVVADGICYYHDIPLGLYILRGDSIVLTGQLDAIKEEETMKKVDHLEELENISKQQGVAVWDFDSDLIA